MKSKPIKNSKAMDSLKSRIPGGVDGNAKYFDYMPVAKSAFGCRIVDVEDNEYIDYCCGYGPLIFGHDDPEIIHALSASLKNSGISYGLPHLLMEEAASLICRWVKCAEMVRFTNSGTEATLTSIRLARGITNRDKIVKFYGAYHGSHEAVLIGSKAKDAKPNYPHVDADSAGIPAGVIQDTYVLPFNDDLYVTEFLDRHADEIAAVLVEPVLGSYGVVAEKGFLETLRNLTTRYGVILIYDEIITGFRLALGGAQELFGVVPDLVTLGKSMGGGFPLAALAGPRKYMEKIAPKGYLGTEDVVYHSGTFNANPLAMTAVITVINKLMSSNCLKNMYANGEKISRELLFLMEKYGIEGTTTGIGPFVQWFFGLTGKIRNPEQLVKADLNLAKRFHRLLLSKGVFFMPALRGYVSAAHTPDDIDITIASMEEAFQQL